MRAPGKRFLVPAHGRRRAVNRAFVEGLDAGALSPWVSTPPPIGDPFEPQPGSFLPEEPDRFRALVRQPRERRELHHDGVRRRGQLQHDNVGTGSHSQIERTHSAPSLSTFALLWIPRPGTAPRRTRPDGAPGVDILG